MASSIVITGVESVLPFNPKIDKNSYTLDNLNTKQLNFSDSEQICLGIDDEEIEKNFKKREIKKQDRFSLLGQLLTNRLLSNTQLQITKDNCHDIGIILGNNLGGWTYVEKQLIDMYREGLNKIKPYVATSWFPTAIQGEISINHGIKGYSKTICADNLSSGLALKHSIQMVENSTCSHVITGAVESPNTPLVFNSISQQNKYLCESGIFVLVENGDNLKSENRKPIAEIITYQNGHDIKKSIENIDENIDYAINYNLKDDINNLIQNVLNEEVECLTFNDNLELGSVSSLYAIYLSLNYFQNQKDKVLLINSTDSDNEQYFSVIIKIL